MRCHYWKPTLKTIEPKDTTAAQMKARYRAALLSAGTSSTKITNKVPPEHSGACFVPRTRETLLKRKEKVHVSVIIRTCAQKNSCLHCMQRVEAGGKCVRIKTYMTNTIWKRTSEE